MGVSYEKQYIQLLRRINEEGVLEYNERTRHYTKRTVGTMISCDLQVEWPLLSVRKMYPRTGAAELAWMLSGTQDGTWLKRYSKIWEKFEEDGLLRAAYGYRWRTHFGRDQVAECISLLQRDPSSRQAVVFAWDPTMDGLGNSGKMKNIPCHMGFSACVLGGRLDLCVYQRSLDTVVGLPYDILLYGLLNMAMARSIGVNPGKVSIAFGDTHVYDSHFDIAKKLVEEGEGLIAEQKWAFDFSSQSVEDITLFPDKYVSDVVDAFFNFKYSSYAPTPEVVL